MPESGEVEKAKRWALLRFREMLRGAKVTGQIRRWASGELPEYRFMLELALNDDARNFIADPANAAKLDQERLV